MFNACLLTCLFDLIIDTEMEEIIFSKMTVNFYQIIRHHITENIYKSSFLCFLIPFYLFWLFLSFVLDSFLCDSFIFVFISPLFFTSHQYALISNSITLRSSSVLFFLRPLRFCSIFSLPYPWLEQPVPISIS